MAAHVVGITDTEFAQGFAGRDIRIAATGADEDAGIGGVARDERIQYILRSLGVGTERKGALEIVRVDLEGNINLEQVVATEFFLGALMVAGGKTIHHGGEDGDEGHDDQQFEEREGGSGGKRTRHRLHQEDLKEKGETGKIFLVKMEAR